MRRITLRQPVILERSAPLCRCGNWPDDGRHEPLAECFGNGLGACPDPSVHHAYRPEHWWRRFHLERSWERWP